LALGDRLELIAFDAELAGVPEEVRARGGALAGNGPYLPL
jgi:hypothetical protein